MPTTPTQLPVPSEKPQDLKFNSGKIDEFVTSMGWTYTDRFGNKHYTIEGINYLAQQVMNAFGYITLTGVDFDTGATVSTPNEVLFNPGENSYYKWTGSFSSGGKVVPQESTPESTGGIGPGKWLNVGDTALRGQISDPDGAEKYPDLQIARWRDEGDIRGWGAVCDDSTDDVIAINSAIADTGGRIKILNKIFISTHLLFKNMTNPIIKFENGASVRISPAFVFANAYRGIIVFDTCLNPKAIDATIIGAKIDKLVGGADPIEDGDAGIAYMNCTGLCHSIRPNIKDVKSWGVIHVGIEDFHVESAVIHNPQVQSGIGGTGFRTGLVSNPIITDSGLYGVELETINSNLQSSIVGGVIKGSQKGCSIVHNTDNAVVSGVNIINCKTGVSVTSGDSGLSSGQASEILFLGNKITSCLTSMECIYSNDVTFESNISSRLDLSFYTRTRSYDRIYKMNGSTGYVSNKTPVGLNVGDKIKLDDGVDYVISSVSSATTDAIFGSLIGITCTPSLPSTAVRRSFKRYVDVQASQEGVVMYGGSRNHFLNNTFNYSTKILTTYGAITDILWRGNYAQNCGTYFLNGLAGAVTGVIHIDVSDNLNVAAWGSDVGKYTAAFSAVRTYNFYGGTSFATVNKTRSVLLPDCVISKFRCVLDSGETTTGNIVLKFNSINVLTSFSGTPKSASGTYASGIGSNGYGLITLTDTVGDLLTTWYSVELRGVFK